MWILGISLSHNGGIALIHNGKVVCAIQAERISRQKRQALFLTDDQALITQCVQYILASSGISYSKIDSIAITSPWKVTPVDRPTLESFVGGPLRTDIRIDYVPHHLSHAEYAIHYIPKNRTPCLALVIDGSGSYENDRSSHTIQEPLHNQYIGSRADDGKEVVSCYYFDGKELALIYKNSPSINPEADYNQSSKGLIQSIGHYWRWSSWYCCGSHNDAGKVMGLAAFADTDKLPEPYGSWSITNGICIDYQRLYSDFKKPNFVGQDISGNAHYVQVAGMLQRDTDNMILGLLTHFQEKFAVPSFCYAGGVALNVVTNEKIYRSGLFDHIYMNGSCEDNGTALGAALSVHAKVNKQRSFETITDYYGREYSSNEILDAVQESGFNYEILDDSSLCEHAAKRIADGEIAGWFQGKSEFGPRALGNRSILANPSLRHTKSLLDVRMKQRDRYRPYAPIVLTSSTSKYFDLEGDSPVMMREGRVHDSALLPAITHVDKSARVQTVSEEDNLLLHRLISAFAVYSGFPVLLNTSFNQPGEPIVESPTDALKSFGSSNLDCLYIGTIFVTNKSRTGLSTPTNAD